MQIRPKAFIPKEPTPIADLSGVDGPLNREGNEYHDRISTSRTLSPSEWQEQFEIGKIGELEGKSFDLVVTRRPEFDAFKYDHMIVAVPKSEGMRGVWDFSKMIHMSPRDAILFIESGLSIISAYEDDMGEDKEVAFAVLNNSPLDPGVTFTGDGGNGKKRLPQSLMIPHLKVMGYEKEDLSAIDPSQEQLVFIHRPLQKELDNLVGHFAKKQGVSVNNHQDFDQMIVRAQTTGDILEIYKRVHEALFAISVYTVGPVSIQFSGGAPMTKEKLKQFMEDPATGIGEDGRPERSWVLEQLERNILRLTSDDESRARFFESSVHFEDDPKALELIIEYLKSVQAHIQKSDRVEIPYGPSYSFLLFSDGIIFVPADYVPKGASTITGILPNEEKRPLSDVEKQGVIDGNNLVHNALANISGGAYTRAAFDSHKYFAQFE